MYLVDFELHSLWLFCSYYVGDDDEDLEMIVVRDVNEGEEVIVCLPSFIWVQSIA
jgi:hypothetical protein